MATINEVYGNNFNQHAFSSRVHRLTDLIAGNFANLNFNLRHNFAPLFRNQGIDPAELEQIVAKTKALNPNIAVLPIKKDTPEINMLPYLLTIPAEYFRIVDIERQKIYLVYISTEHMEPY